MINNQIAKRTHSKYLNERILLFNFLCWCRDKHLKMEDCTEDTIEIFCIEYDKDERK